jgi:hypothetical protein
MEQATDREIGGSHLQGYTTSTFQNIIDKLGKPHSQGDAYKTDAQWAFKFEDGTVATLYNWTLLHGTSEALAPMQFIRLRRL